MKILTIYKHGFIYEESNPRLIYKIFRKKKSHFSQFKSILYYDNKDPTLCKFISLSIGSNTAKGFGHKVLSKISINNLLISQNKNLMLPSFTLDHTTRDKMIDIYGDFIFDLAVSLVPADIKIMANQKSLKVNYFSLGSEYLQKQVTVLKLPALNIMSVDNIEGSLHLDRSPAFSGFNSNLLVLTFCIIRGLNGYNDTMGKGLFFPSVADTKGNIQDIVIYPDNDNDEFFTMAIFPSDITVHGSTTWNKDNDLVKTQFTKCKNEVIDTDIMPGRISITICIHFLTENPYKLWKSIQERLSI